MLTRVDRIQLAVRDRAAAEDQQGRLVKTFARPFPKWYMTDLLQELIHEGTPVHAVPIRGGWIEVDNVRDLELGRTISAEQGGLLRINR